MYPNQRPTDDDLKEGCIWGIAFTIIIAALVVLLFPIAGLILIMRKGGWAKSPSYLKILWTLSILIPIGLFFIVPILNSFNVPKNNNLLSVKMPTERPTATITLTRTSTSTATATYTATPTLTVTPNMTATKIIEYVAATQQAAPNQQLSILYPSAGSSISGNELTIAWNSRQLNNKDYYFITLWKEAEGSFTFACATVTQQKDKRDKTVNFLSLDWKDTCSLTGSGHKAKAPTFTTTFKINVTIFNQATGQPSEKSSDIEFEWQR